MVEGRIEVNIHRGEEREFRNGRLVRVRRRRRTSSGLGEITSEAEVSHEKIPPKFHESVQTQERQQEQFASMLARAPFEKFSKFDPFITRFVPEDKRADATRFIAQQSFAAGSEVVGTFERLGLGTEEASFQVRKRTGETIRTGIDVGVPLVSQTVRFLRTPKIVKFAGVSKGETVLGVGTSQTRGQQFLQPFVEESTPFFFKQQKVGGLQVSDDVALIAGRSDVATSVTPSGRGVSAAEQVVLDIKRGDVGGVSASQQLGVSKATGQRGDLIASASKTLQTSDTTLVSGTTSQGVQFRGGIRQLPDSSITSRGGGGLSTQQVSSLGTDITQSLTPSAPVTKPVGASVVKPAPKPDLVITEIKPKPKGTPFARQGQLTEVTTRQAVIPRERTRQRQDLGLAVKDKTKARTKQSIVGDVARITERDKIASATRLRPATDLGLKTKGRLKLGTTTIPILAQPTIKIRPILTPAFLPHKPKKVRRKTKGKKGKQPRRFASTAFASTFDIKGTPTKLGIKTGLGLRPLSKKSKGGKIL